MSISPQMQERIDRIESLIDKGYTLKETPFANVDFRNSSGKRINTTFGSPAGFSWVTFFFSGIICARARVWSFFYIVGVAEIMLSLVHAITKYDVSNFVGYAVPVWYGFMMPYLRKLNKDRGVKDLTMAWAIIGGIFLTMVAVLPSVFLDSIFDHM